MLRHDGGLILLQKRKYCLLFTAKAPSTILASGGWGIGLCDILTLYAAYNNVMDSSFFKSIFPSPPRCPNCCWTTANQLYAKMNTVYCSLATYFFGDNFAYGSTNPILQWWNECRKTLKSLTKQRWYDMLVYYPWMIKCLLQFSRSSHDMIFHFSFLTAESDISRIAWVTFWVTDAQK